VDPLKVNLKADPLRIAGPLEVEPLKIEMDPLEIIIRSDGVGVLPGDPTESPEEPTEEPQKEAAPWDYELLLMISVIVLVLSFMVFLTRASILQGKLHKELVDCLRNRPRPNPMPTPSLPTPVPASGEIEVEA
jgi:hypothetical protein